MAMLMLDINLFTRLRILSSTLLGQEQPLTSHPSDVRLFDTQYLAALGKPVNNEKSRAYTIYSWNVAVT